MAAGSYQNGVVGDSFESMYLHGHNQEIQDTLIIDF